MLDATTDPAHLAVVFVLGCFVAETIWISKAEPGIDGVTLKPVRFTDNGNWWQQYDFGVIGIFAVLMYLSLLAMVLYVKHGIRLRRI